MQRDADLFICEGGEDNDAFAINPSCDLNVWLCDTFTLTTMRTIATGEELTIDYAMLGGDGNAPAERDCRCGSAVCRGAITGTDWTIASLQKRYAGHFIPLISKRITATAS